MIKHALSVGSNLFALAHVAERISAFLLRKCALRHKDADVMDGGGRTIWGGGGGGLVFVSRIPFLFFVLLCLWRLRAIFN